MSNQNGFTVLHLQKKKLLLDKLKRRKADGYYREGSFSHEIIWEDRKFLFPSKRGLKDGIWIFRSVMSDVRFYIEDKRIREKPRLPVNLWNDKLKNYRGRITATDVDHAYWRIAYLQGAIKETTYKKGLLIKSKELRLAALANLASIKEYRIIRNGVVTKDKKVLKYDPILQKVYNNIRFTCYEYMMEMAKMLGEDFICYKTDCIYYKDTEHNRLMIQTYLDSNNLEWKQLVEPERPKNEDEQEVL